MRRGSLPGILSLCLIAAETFAQSETLPTEVPTNPRAIAMGESFVALRAEPTALMSNPAGLAGLRGVGISYARRSIDWMTGLQDFAYYSGNAYLALPFGVFGVQYNRFTMGEFLTVTSPSPGNPVGYAEWTERIYEHSVAVGFATEPVENLAAGCAVKLFDAVHSVVGSPPPGGTGYSTTPAFLFDVGAQYTLPFSLGGPLLENGITGGVSLQNLGSQFISSSSGVGGEYSDQLPRYLRVGVAVKMNLLPSREGDLRPAAVALTSEYVRQLNGGFVRDSERGGWGFGAECVFYEIVSVRVGGMIRPYSNIYSKSGVFMPRGGIGVRLPLEMLGAPAPIAVSCSYAAIPIDRYPNSFMIGNVNYLSAFSVGLEYTKGL